MTLHLLCVCTYANWEETKQSQGNERGFDISIFPIFNILYSFQFSSQTHTNYSTKNRSKASQSRLTFVFQSEVTFFNLHSSIIPLSIYYFFFQFLLQLFDNSQCSDAELSFIWYADIHFPFNSHNWTKVPFFLFNYVVLFNFHTYPFVASTKKDYTWKTFGSEHICFYFISFVLLFHNWVWKGFSIGTEC